jgi:hypothetical protein
MTPGVGGMGKVRRYFTGFIFRMPRLKRYFRIVVPGNGFYTKFMINKERAKEI